MSARPPGVILGKVNDVYSKVGSSMMNDPNSIVGLYYYNHDNELNTLIYRIFDGTVYPFFTHETSFERLSTHYLIQALCVYEFNLESWRLDGHRDSLLNRIKSAISRCIIESSLSPNYTELIQSVIESNPDGPVGAGYYRINSILLSIMNENLTNSRRKSSLHRSIVDCKYLNTKQNIKNSSVLIHYDSPCEHELMLDSTKKLTELSNGIINFMCAYEHRTNNLTDIFTNPTVIELVRNVIVKKDHTNTINYLSTRETKTNTDKTNEDVSTELTEFRNILECIMDSFVQRNTAVISITDLIKIYNKLASTHNVPTINPPPHNSVHYQSIGAIITSSDNNIHSSEVKVELRSGDVLTIPCTGEGIESLSSDEKLEVLRYVLSLRNGTLSYNGLLDVIVEHCSR